MTAILQRLRLTSGYGITGLGIALSIAAVVVTFIVVLGALIIGLSRYYGHISCRNFATQTGRPTKFVIYNPLATGDCLTPSGSGTWIPTKNLREFGAKP